MYGAVFYLEAEPEEEIFKVIIAVVRTSFDGHENCNRVAVVDELMFFILHADINGVFCQMNLGFPLFAAMIMHPDRTFRIQM